MDRKPNCLKERAAETKQAAKAVLGGHSGGHYGGMSHRLILTLAVIIVMTVSIALYAAVGCLAMAGSLVFGDTVWVDAVANVLLVALLLGLALPLAVSLGRLACLMAAPDGEVVNSMAVSVPTPDLVQFFYPFTSLRAYGRTMAVGMEKLAFLLVGAGLPILGGRLAYLSMITAGIRPWICGLAVAGMVILGLGWGFFVLLLAGKRMGFAYFVFVYEALPLSEANRYFRTLRRPLRFALRLRVTMLGAYALSMLGICVPFVFHSIPLGLCCKAVYGRDLTRSENEA